VIAIVLVIAVGVVLVNVGEVFTDVAVSLKCVFEVAAATGLVAGLVAAVFAAGAYTRPLFSST